MSTGSLSSTIFVASASHLVDLMFAVGPQYWNMGNVPSGPVRLSCSCGGYV